MKLKSDLCLAAGSGFTVFVDTDVCFDDYGLPYIPAKRLKGGLRECGRDIISVDSSLAPVFAELFGETGRFVPGTLNIGNGKLENYADIVEQLGSVHTSELAEIYTSLRYRTKLEAGVAAAGSLRTVRVLNKGLVFYFPVTLNEEAENFFQMCVASLHNIGLNRSRGLGEVECSLHAGPPAQGVNFAVQGTGKDAIFSYCLELIDPIISTARDGQSLLTEDYIFGSSLLGAFAAKYIEKYTLTREEAYKNDAFRRIFLQGDVKFTAALPYKDGKVFYPAPAALKTDKLELRLSDESAGIPVETDEQQPICKRLGGYISVDYDGVVSRLTPDKTSFPHHARPADKAKGHATDEDGSYFAYEALSRGQTFAGSIIGKADDIHKLAALFDRSDVLRIGRSRTTQYGQMKITAASGIFAGNRLILRKGDFVRLVAITPLILETENGINTTDVNLVRAALGADFTVVQIIATETVAAGYWGLWRLPRRQERAIAEGSTIVFQYGGEETTLDLNFIGKRTGEGFGQIRLEPVPRADTFSFAPEVVSAAVSDISTFPAVAELRANKEAVTAGVRYGESFFRTAPDNSNLSRILSALSSAGAYGELASNLCEIKQPKQKVAALSFATKKDKKYFKEDSDHRLIQSNITLLLEQSGYDYPMYRKYLNAAVQRIKQKRRNRAENRNGDESNE
jgi:CRISPR-associated protein Csx10